MDHPLLQPRETGVLSVYVTLDPADTQRRGFEARCTDAIHEARATKHPRLSMNDLDAAADHVRTAITEIDVPRGRGIVLFAEPSGIIEATETALALPTLGRFTPAGVLAPLIIAEAAEPHGIAALVDDQQAIFFAVEQHRAVRAEHQRDSWVPARQDQGGWSQSRYQRHREMHVHEHYQQVAHELERLLRASDPATTWVALGGHHEAVAALERELPSIVSARTTPQFNGQFHDPVEQLEDYARAAMQEAQDAQNLADVGHAINNAASGGRGAVGWPDVLRALAEGAVHALFIPMEPAPVPASRDQDGLLNAAALGAPSWTRNGVTVEPAELPFDAVHDAIRHGAQVRAVRGDAAARVAAASGAVATLRHA